MYFSLTKSLRGSFDLLCWCILPLISFVTLYVFFRFMVKPNTSDIWMTFEKIRVTYKLTFEWHTDGMQFERKIKLSFLKLFDNSYSKYLICERIPFICNGCFRLFSKIKKGSGINFWCTFSAWSFMQMLFI